MNNDVSADHNVTLVDSLAQQCLCYVVMHLEEFPAGHLSLLPLSIRRKILRTLPIADICQLDETSFVEGLDMAEYWKNAYKYGDPGVAYAGMVDPEDKAIQAYIADWDKTTYAKAIIHGMAISSAIECRSCDFLGFSLPPDFYWGTFNTVAFLYGIRQCCLKNQPIGDGSDEGLTFPPRYRRLRDLSLRWNEWFDDCYADSMDEELKQDMIEAVMGCFRNQLPKYHGEITVYDDIKLEYAYYFREVVYLGILSSPLEDQSLEFVMAILDEATHLQVLVMEFGEVNLGLDTERVPLNELCSELSNKWTLLSNLQILKIQKHHDGCAGYFVSRENFDNLVSAYLSAPTNHPQKLHICDTIIKSEDTLLPPKINSHYLHFKTMELDNCQFQVVSNRRATPRVIECQWLGNDISVLKSEDNSCSFKIEPEDMQLD